MLGSVTEACGDPPGNICEWVYDRTDGNSTLAELADWLISRPLQILLILVAAWLVSKLARRWIRRFVERFMNPDRDLAARQLQRIGVRPPPMLTTEVADPRRETRTLAISGLLASTASALIWTIAFMLIAAKIGLDLAPLLAGAGIAGIAIGFGAQSLVRDWLSGLFMTLEDQYGVGDVVDVGPATGVVERITLRATVLRGVDGTVWHVPNGQILRVGNRSQLWSVALLDVTVASGSDLGRVRATDPRRRHGGVPTGGVRPDRPRSPRGARCRGDGSRHRHLAAHGEGVSGQPIHDPTCPPGGDQGGARSRRRGDPTTSSRRAGRRTPATISRRAQPEG